jgi:hypothetical protein
MNDRPEFHTLEDRFGRQDEQDVPLWTVAFDEHTRELALCRRADAGLDPRLLRIALRTGALSPAPEMLAELEGSIPDGLDVRAGEAKVWEAVLEGDRGRRELSLLDRQRIGTRLARLYSRSPLTASQRSAACTSSKTS